MDELNPYAAPRSQVLEDDPDAARIRRENLPTESHLKAVGVLVVFAGLLNLAAQVMMGRILSEVFGAFRLSAFKVAATALPLLFGGALFFLKPWAWRGTCLGLAFLILVGVARFPRGMADVIIHAAVLRYLLSAKTRRVFSADYQDVIRLTPLMRTRPARWVYMLMGGTVVLLALAYGVIRR